MGVLPITPTSDNDIHEMNKIHTAKIKNRYIGQGMNSPASSRSPTGVDMVKNHMTFSQDDEIDEEVETHDFPITLIELLNDLEYGHKRHANVVPTMESRKSYEGDRDSSGTDELDELSRHIRRLRESCATEPKKNGSMYKDELLSTWTLEPTDLSSHPMNLSKNDILNEDDAFHEIIEPDLTNVASSKEDESSSEASLPPVFTGWCGMMMCTQNDSILDQSPSDDDDDERSWKKDDSLKRRVFGRRHLLKDDDCIYMTNEASASLHDSLTLSSHYHAIGKKTSKLLNEMSERANHYQVAALQASQDPVSPSDNKAPTEQQQQELHVDDTQHIVGCMRKEICMYSTNGFNDFREDFCVVPEDFKSFDQIGDQQDSMKEERPTFETILVESQQLIPETLVLSGRQEISDDVELNPRPTESSGEEGIPFPRPFEALKNWQDMSIFSGPMTRLKEIMAGADGHPKGYPRPFQINTSFNCISSQAVQSPSERQSAQSKGQEVHLELHNNICKSEHGMRRQRTIDFNARRNSSTMDADVLSEATDVLSLDWFADENNEDVLAPMSPNSRNTGTFSKAHDEHSKPLVLLMDGLKLSKNNVKNGPIGSGDTSIRNNLTSSALGPDDTMQYLQAESYDSEPEPNVSDFVDDDSDDEESLIDYAALEREVFQRELASHKVAPSRQ